MRDYVIHLMDNNHFTRNLIKWFNSDDLSNKHLFILNAKETNYSNVVLWNKKNIPRILKLLTTSNKILIHGSAFITLLFFIPKLNNRVYWVINGFELYNIRDNKLSVINKHIYLSVFGKAFAHLTHVEEDSKLANNLVKSKAKFVYSPMYLSNVIKNSTIENKNRKNKGFRLLVGNSCSRNNNHKEIFESIQYFRKDIDKIICPLSYGDDLAYRNEVISYGRELFGNKFQPLLKFMNSSDYDGILNSIDCAIFNHNRQEAMGVTIRLLSLGKVVFMNPATTSYASFIRRGFEVYNNQDLFTKGFKDFVFETKENEFLIQKYYSEDVLKKSYQELELMVN